MRNFKDLINKVYRGNSIDFSICQNLNLAITKLIKRDIIENSRLKIDFLNNFKNYQFKIGQLINKRLNFQSDVFNNQGYESVYSGKLKTKSRLIIGLGSSSVLETSITLHHIYGIPYIPATALKGVCRMVAFWKNAENKNKLENLEKEFYGNLSSDGEILKYQILFGAQNFKGILLFLDAYPVIRGGEQIFDLDIINVHYPSYYSDQTGTISPGDWENPNPIFFLTLKEGIEFEFNVLLDEYRKEKLCRLSDGELEKLKMPEILKEVIKNIDSNLSSEIESLLKEALNCFGIGAKTRLGYGIFE